MNRSPFVAHCRELYRRTLLEDILPFWMKHTLDRQYGGISNVVDDAGNVVNHDKYLWSQGRALWTFSALCNRIEPRPEWREFADHIFRYLRSHGRDAAGRWMYRLDRDGHVLDADTSLYVDGFVMAGLGEYYVATGNEESRQLAVETYDSIRARLQQPGSYGTVPYEIPAGLKSHGIRMIFSFFFFNLGTALAREDLRATGRQLAQEILEEFYVPEKNAILEFITLDGKFHNSPAGHACVPGHALEGLWFLITMFEQTGEIELIPRCCELIRRHLELAWDNQSPGLLLALDIDGHSPGYWKNPTCKPWWVQCEALVATAFAYAHTRQPWCLEWHQRIQEFAFAHYPVPTGEWTQWLDRDLQKMPSAALPVKDPFHLPRALLYLIDLFETRIKD